MHEALPSKPQRGGVRFVFNSDAPARVLEEALRADISAAQLSKTFRIYYHLRGLIPLPLRQLLQRYRKVAHAPDWYLPGQFEAALAAAITAEAGVPAIHPWPDDARFAFVPTHDVETAEGMRNIPQIADLEERLGFRSSWNIVPHKYPIDLKLLTELQARGFEIGVHGYNHDGKLFANRKIFDQRVSAINTALKSLGAIGFRAPMVHRNLDWLQSLDIEYDASCFDIDPFQAMPGGVGGVWPFIAGRFVELPYTLPQDHTLFVASNEQDGCIWHEKLNYVAALGGMAMVITHPDYLDAQYRIDAYRRLLESVTNLDGVWRALPKDVAAWWRQRDQSTLVQEVDGRWLINGPARARGRAAALRVTASNVPRKPISDRRLAATSLAKLEWNLLPMAPGGVERSATSTFV